MDKETLSNYGWIVIPAAPNAFSLTLKNPAVVDLIAPAIKEPNGLANANSTANIKTSITIHP